MKVVLAPDKFAGTLSAADAAAAMARGWAAARPGDEIVGLPMADGGEGTVDVLAGVIPAALRRTLEVADARGRATEGQWLLLPGGIAIVEAAQACGLSRLDPRERDPRLTTSYGVGQLLLAAAADPAVSHILLGLGGSATVDGGAGMATALGWRLLRADGNGVKVGGQFLRCLDRVVAGPSLDAAVVTLVDVSTPLLGPDGAVPTFAPQKGAGAGDLPVLTEALNRLADVVERDLPGGPWRDLPGSGAAGGLGFAAAAFLGARLTPGAAAVGDLVGLGAALTDAGAVVTGEGSLDAQSLAGKVPAAVAATARAAGARVYAVAGRVTPEAAQAFDRTLELGPDGPARAAELVEQRTRELAQRM